MCPDGFARHIRRISLRRLQRAHYGRLIAGALDENASNGVLQETPLKDHHRATRRTRLRRRLPLYSAGSSSPTPGSFRPARSSRTRQSSLRAAAARLTRHRRRFSKRREDIVAHRPSKHRDLHHDDGHRDHGRPDTRPPRAPRRSHACPTCRMSGSSRASASRAGRSVTVVSWQR